jgi:chaperone required for assembly of F1-ATPase
MEIGRRMKRFYKQAMAAEADGAWRVELDGRPIRTQLGNPQRVPSRALAEALAAEWAAQGEEIDAASFFFRDLADYAIDVVAKERDEVIASLLPYGETDTLCYRADPDEPFFPRQLEVWEPLLREAEDRWGVKFTRISGIMHRPQPVETIARLKGLLEVQDEFALAALKTLASLAASLIIGLAALEEGADAKALWDAASLEEDWQAEQWGQDWMAQERQEKRFADFTRAMRFAELVRR